MAAGAAAAAAAAAAAQAQAMKAQGVVVQLSPPDFLNLLDKTTKALILHSETGIVNRKQRYLVSYKGLAFYTDSPEKLPMPADSEVMPAKRIWVPDNWS
jgi:hypothetical protein